MEDKLLTLYRTRLVDAGGWCEDADSGDSVISVIQRKYGFELNEIVISGKVASMMTGTELPSVEISTIHPPDRRSILTHAKLGITACDGLIAETGTAVLVNHPSEPRELSLLPERHVVVAKKDQLFTSLDECLKQIKDNYTAGKMPSITLISGPSRTSDIEKTLVIGVHGPKEFGVVVVDG